MKALITLEQVFQKTPEGFIWGPGIYAQNYWNPYLKVFAGVKVMARIKNVNEVEGPLNKMNREGIEFIPLPCYQGPWEFCRRAFGLIKKIGASFNRKDAIVMSVPSTIASILGFFLTRAEYPYGVRVVGDPYEVFSKGGVNSAFRPFFRWGYTQSQKRICAEAHGAAYVTQGILQRRYPCKNKEFGISDVDLDIFANERKKHQDGDETGSDQWDPAIFSREQYPFPMPGQKIRIITVGSLEQRYKGIDLVIEAVAELSKRGFDIELKILGDGKFRILLADGAQKMNIRERVHFLGKRKYGKKVFEELRAADLFVLASRAEGLPRAMIEAMSAGLPCIGSSVGGIPELLDQADICLPNSKKALTEKLSEVITEKGRLERMALRNVEKAKEFRGEKLQESWIQFFTHIKKGTENWLEKNKR